MKVYLVGGAVRDALLGLSDSDRDWLVVGSTPEEMASLGYQPVGKDFPVFCTQPLAKNMHWQERNAKQRGAPKVSRYTPPQMSP